MDVEKKRPEIAKKLCNMGRIVLYMMRKNIVLLKRRKIGHFTCRSNNDIISTSEFFPPRDYEFSCSDTPLYSMSKRKKNHHHHHHHHHRRHDVVEIDSSMNIKAAAADTVEIDSSCCQVDKDAEEFINKFYKDLRKQKRFAALESPSPLYHHLSSIH